LAQLLRQLVLKIYITIKNQIKIEFLEG